MMRDKVIKQNIILISALVIIVLVCGVVSIIIENTGIVHSEIEMVQFIKEDKEINGELMIVDTLFMDNPRADDDRITAYDKLLLLCIGGEAPGESFVAAQFNIVGENEYKFEHYIEFGEFEDYIYSRSWNEQFVVVCNNLEAVRYEAVVDGTAQEGNVISTPKVFIFEFENSCRVEFYDAEGEMII